MPSFFDFLNMQVMADIEKFHQSFMPEDFNDTSACAKYQVLQTYISEAIENIAKPAKLLVLEAFLHKGVGQYQTKTSDKEKENIYGMLTSSKKFIEKNKLNINADDIHPALWSRCNEIIATLAPKFLQTQTQ